ncbi:MAG: hypothetical protein FJ313_07925, partial [Gemmatimonadetes bacterium]|nr:hypothetical protein [Gemmatimonadota bacterium]
KLAAEAAPRLAEEREAEAAERMRRLGSLAPVEARRRAAAVSKDQRVEAMGPVKTPREWAVACEAIREAAIAAARAGQTITYEAIHLVAYEATGLKLSFRMNGRMCMEINRGEDGCLLSSIIVRTDTGRPGDGFEPFARQSGFSDPLGVLQQAVFRHFGGAA